MRIRTKLLVILLCLVVPPLLATSYNALRQAKHLGQDLADGTAASFKRSAERELALMVDLIGEDINDNRQMQELSVALLAQAAGHALATPAPPETPVYFDSAFDAGGGVPPQLTRLTSANGLPMPATADAPSLHLPRGLSREASLEDARRLATLLPTLSLLRQNLEDNLLWAYVALPSGLMATYPGHGGLPPEYDARAREWYTAALSRNGTSWRILVDASTKRLTATVSAPVHDREGNVIGVAGIDAPLEAMMPDSDLSKRWGEGIRALIVASEKTPSGDTVMILADREFLDQAHGWNTPLTAYPLKSDDTGSLARLTTAMAAKQSALVGMTIDGVPSLAAYKPFPSTQAGLLVVVPRSAVQKQADSAETAILARTQNMMLVVAAFTLAAIAAAVVLAIFGARAVTRPVMALSNAASQLAQGNMSARAQVGGRDELADLARAFNEMAPKLSERLRLKQDMLLAMEVQQNLLPQAPPKLPGLDIAGATFFCDETGGDYFDYLHFTPQYGNGCDVILGDVTGHGISAALFMATGRALLRGRVDADSGPGTLLTLVNALLFQDTRDSGRFITLFFLRLEKGGLPPDGRLTWARAGHDPALLYDPATDSFEELMGPGIPLGVVEDFAYADQSRPGLAPGQILAIGTDGIWEARNPQDAMYGKDRLMQVLRREAKAPAEAIIAAVREDVARFQAGCPQEDDITLVVIRALPA